MFKLSFKELMRVRQADEGKRAVNNMSMAWRHARMLVNLGNWSRLPWFGQSLYIAYYSEKLEHRQDSLAILGVCSEDQWPENWRRASVRIWEQSRIWVFLWLVQKRLFSFQKLLKVIRTHQMSMVMHYLSLDFEEKLKFRLDLCEDHIATYYSIFVANHNWVGSVTFWEIL